VKSRFVKVFYAWYYCIFIARYFVEFIKMQYSTLKYTPSLLVMIGLAGLLVIISASRAPAQRITTDAEFEQDVHDYHQECRAKGGGTVSDCDNMVKLMRAAHDPKTPASPCEAAQLAAYVSCAQRIGESRTDEGDRYYLARDLVKDLPLCESVGADVFQSCVHFGK
jgi:hypothetical protein